MFTNQTQNNGLTDAISGVVDYGSNLIRNAVNGTKAGYNFRIPSKGEVNTNDLANIWTASGATALGGAARFLKSIADNTVSGACIVVDGLTSAPSAFADFSRNIVKAVGSNAGNVYAEDLESLTNALVQYHINPEVVKDMNNGAYSVFKYINTYNSDKWVNVFKKILTVGYGDAYNAGLVSDESIKNTENRLQVMNRINDIIKNYIKDKTKIGAPKLSQEEVYKDILNLVSKDHIVLNSVNDVVYRDEHINK